MAGYIGSKAVNLSTTGADIAGDADVSGALDVGGAFTSKGIDDNATSTAMTLDASGRVGIGTSLPDAKLKVAATGANLLIGYSGTQNYFDASENIFRNFAGSEAMRIDSSGNLLVSATTTSGFQSSSSESGTIAYAAGGIASNSPSNDVAGVFNRLGTDGIIAQLKKDGSTVGFIGNIGTNIYFTGQSASGLFFGGSRVQPMNNGSLSDNSIDMGHPSYRFQDIYATNVTIQTSDRNEKQDIAELTDAEQRVAVAAKGLMRKFRWRDAVEAKGENARTHFGIIAQDLQAAFAAEGLDASRYAMFCSNTWWETQTEVPAVEAVAEVLDEEGNVVTEAVEAADAYTRTDTYDTQEEAPEGATERTRLGVRYSELLAFIIGAL